MKESVLHYIWQYKLFASHLLQTTEGEPVEIIDIGKLNTDAGPDFFNAKIKIGSTLWAGNVEIHTKASDWYRHHHNTDTAYNNVILHVVKYADQKITRTDGEIIPQLILQYPERIETEYEKLISEKLWIPCADKIKKVPTIFISGWKNVLLTERLEQKMDSIMRLLSESNKHWEEAFYIILARSFGFGTNSQAFEILAKSVPLSILGKHKNDLFQLEAVLFGQAGFLTADLEDDYGLRLRSEYDFLSKKYGLVSMNKSQWKLLRLRPDNFPHIRIAQFAALIHNSTKLFSKIIEQPDIEYLRSLFKKIRPSGYWESHYTFGNKSVQKVKSIGEVSINSIIINTVVPFIFCYAHQKGKQDLKEKSISLLENLPAEKNAIVKGWSQLGLETENAYDTQALLQLKKFYCDEKKCLICRIGHKVLTLQT
ncbi:MAG: DUF2851 family protein [Paludibacter sp.]|nr:DUF2851 family protein [Paludibacter sp.]